MVEEEKKKRGMVRKKKKENGRQGGLEQRLKRRWCRYTDKHKGMLGLACGL